PAVGPQPTPQHLRCAASTQQPYELYTAPTGPPRPLQCPALARPFVERHHGPWVRPFLHPPRWTPHPPPPRHPHRRTRTGPGRFGTGPPGLPDGPTSRPPTRNSGRMVHPGLWRSRRHPPTGSSRIHRGRRPQSRTVVTGTFDLATGVRVDPAPDQPGRVSSRACHPKNTSHTPPTPPVASTPKNTPATHPAAHPSPSSTLPTGASPPYGSSWPPCGPWAPPWPWPFCCSPSWTCKKPHGWPKTPTHHRPKKCSPPSPTP